MKETFAIIIARGTGSSLYRKNLYPLLGKPLLSYALDICRDTQCIDETFVWSEDEDILTLTDEAGAIPLTRPKEMVHYYNGFTTPTQWRENLSQQIQKLKGSVGNYQVAFNCNNFLIRPETIDLMFNKLQNSPSALKVIAVKSVRPRLSMVNPNTGYLFPFWNASNLQFHEHPQLYRHIGVSIVKPSNQPPGPYGNIETMHQVVDDEEGFDFQNEEDIPKAEFFLLRRLKEMQSKESEKGR